MKFRGIVGALLTLCTASVLWAEEGSPSAAKLNKLGLSSLQAVSDQQGLEVRGRGEFVKLVFNWQVAAGEKATVINGQFVPTTPPSVAIHDSNRGSGIATDGGGLFSTVAIPQVINLSASANHEQTVLAPNFTFNEISSAGLVASVIAGNANLLGITGVRP